MRFGAHGLTIEITPEDFRYDPSSGDNIRTYERVYRFGDHQSSVHGLAIYEDARLLTSAVLIAGGGASGVHPHSAIIRTDGIFVAVGAYVARLALPTLELIWATQSDSATCFGIHAIPGSADLLSHGELEISRLSKDGHILWASSGRDIFSGEIQVLPKAVKVMDFDDCTYAFDLSSGTVLSFERPH